MPCFLQTTATNANYAAILGVIGHEYFHNWTGNRVTCRDWFQLSLKEGLTVFRDQEFSSDMGSQAVKRIADVVKLRNYQFPQVKAKFYCFPWSIFLVLVGWEFKVEPLIVYGT